MLKLNEKRVLVIRWSGLVICDDKPGYTSKFDATLRTRTKKQHLRMNKGRQ